MPWLNSDGLYIKFGTEEGGSAKGGQFKGDDSNIHTFAFTVDFRDALSATQSVLGSAVYAGQEAGTFGVIIPKGLRITEVEVFAETAFTSSGTIATSTLQIGLANKSDRTTVLSATALTTAAFTGAALDAAGETTILRVGSTGAGAYIGTTLATEGVVIVANTQHASHPFTAGKAIVKVRGYYP